MSNTTSLMEFPCDFPLKIIGKHSNSFVQDVTSIILKHFPTTPLQNITQKPSDKGNYIALTVTLHVLDQPTLDALYQELGKLPDIKMVL